MDTPTWTILAPNALKAGRSSGKSAFNIWMEWITKLKRDLLSKCVRTRAELVSYITWGQMLGVTKDGYFLMIAGSCTEQHTPIMCYDEMCVGHTKDSQFLLFIYRFRRVMNRVIVIRALHQTTQEHKKIATTDCFKSPAPKKLKRHKIIALTRHKFN